MKFHAICSVLAMSFALPSNVAAENQRPVIYQLMVRTFGNTNETRKVNGTMAENGCGKKKAHEDASVEGVWLFTSTGRELTRRSHITT